MNSYLYLPQISQINNLMKNGMKWVGFHVIIDQSYGKYVKQRTDFDDDKAYIISSKKL